jgi:hypothetical protein
MTKKIENRIYIFILVCILFTVFGIGRVAFAQESFLDKFGIEAETTTSKTEDMTRTQDTRSIMTETSEPVCYQVSDAGTDIANGIYTDTGTVWKDVPVYENDHSEFLYKMDVFDCRHFYVISPTVHDIHATPDDNLYASYAGGGNCTDYGYTGDPVSAPWITDLGDTPIPTVEQVTCPGPGGGEASSTATTTASIYTFQEWLFVNGVIIFLLVLLVLGIYFRPARVKLKDI